METNKKKKEFTTFIEDYISEYASILQETIHLFTSIYDSFTEI